jgi:8-oxo-dGTP diphosphatase
MNPINKVAWIEVKHKAILSTKSHGKDKYYLPGGKRECGESDEQTLCREILEELNVVIDVNSLWYFGTFEAQAHGHPEGVLVKMTCYTASYSGQLQASSEIEEIRWLKYADKDLISEVDKLIFEDLKSKHLIE